MSNTPRLAALGLLSMLAVSTTAVTLVAPAPVLAKPAVHETVARALSSKGTFVTDSAPTSGNVHIIKNKTNGKRYVVLDDTFATKTGPDVFLLLHKSSTPRSYRSQDYISLGKLEKFQGMQVYEIPETIQDLSVFESVVVWCREFNVTFGHAKLGD